MQRSCGRGPFHPGVGPCPSGRPGPTVSAPTAPPVPSDLVSSTYSRPGCRGVPLRPGRGFRGHGPRHTGARRSGYSCRRRAASPRTPEASIGTQTESFNPCTGPIATWTPVFPITVLSSRLGLTPPPTSRLRSPAPRSPRGSRPPYQPLEPERGGHRIDQTDVIFANPRGHLGPCSPDD